MNAEKRLARDHAGARLLLAEDNPVNQEVAQALLHGAGLRLDIADNGSAAVAMAQSTQYDLILMDVQMPVMDGLDATRAIRRLPGGEAIPILALTANAFEEDRLKCIEAGMNDRLSKPIDPGKLFGALLQWLPRRRAEAQPPVPARAPAPVAACEHLSGIPGLDVATGLKYMGGREPMYLRLLRQFARDHGADVERLRAHLACGDLGGARRVAHTLKGVSGTLGAQHIQALSVALETGLNERACDSTVDRMCDELAGDLATLSATILDRLPGD